MLYSSVAVKLALTMPLECNPWILVRSRPGGVLPESELLFIFRFHATVLLVIVNRYVVSGVGTDVTPICHICSVKLL